MRYIASLIILVFSVSYAFAQDGNAGRGNANKDTVIVIKMGRPVVDTLTEIEKEYMAQTSNGQNLTEEKGAVAFFNSTGKAKGSEAYYAFYNGASKGTVIKVTNPGTETTIFVRVLGPLPATKQYHNAVMGLGSLAKAALGVTDNRAWCELKHAVQ
jgi:hypothetical protein